MRVDVWSGGDIEGKAIFVDEKPTHWLFSEICFSPASTSLDKRD